MLSKLFIGNNLSIRANADEVLNFNSDIARHDNCAERAEGRLREFQSGPDFETWHTQFNEMD